MNVENRGQGGTTSGTGVDEAERALRSKPGYLLVCYGANDAIHGRDVDNVASNLRYIVQIAKENQTVVVIATLLPMYDSHAFADGEAHEISARIRLIAEEEGARLVDLEQTFAGKRELLQDDGLHPTAEGAEVIAQAFRGRL